MEIKTLAGWHEYAETHAGSCSMEGFERGCRMKTLTDLKRDASSGRLSLELYAWHGKTGNGIPERIRGVRKVSGVNTVCLKLLSADGTESELRFVRAKLMDYDDKSLIIFAPAAHRRGARRSGRSGKDYGRIPARLVLEGQGLLPQVPVPVDGSLWRKDDQGETLPCT